MSSPSDTSGTLIYIGYFGSIAVTAFAVVVGIFLHWTAAIWGPGLGLFGVNAWVAAFASIAVSVGSIWAWRVCGRRVGNRAKTVGRLIAVAALMGAAMAAQPLLVASWQFSCSESSPRICYHLGGILESSDPVERHRNAYHTACRGGEIRGCRWLAEHSDDETLVRSACEKIINLNPRLVTGCHNYGPTGGSTDTDHNAPRGFE